MNFHDALILFIFICAFISAVLLLIFKGYIIINVHTIKKIKFYTINTMLISLRKSVTN